MPNRIAALYGDYSGPEMMRAGLAVLKAVSQKNGFEYQIEAYPFGGEAIDQVGEPLPEQTLAGCQAADAILLSAIGGPKWSVGGQSPEAGLLKIRQALGLFANIRPTHIDQAIIDQSPVKASVLENTDFVIVRELTSGIYFGQPREEEIDQALDTTIYRRAEVERIVRVAFEYAKGRQQHLTVVDKANVLATSRMWRAIVKEVQPAYPEVEVDYMYVDAASMKIIAEPSFFDVIVTDNLFGDILSDEAAVLPGSLGMIPSISQGASGKALYEPIHGSAPTLANQDRINPISMIRSVSLMLRYSFKRTDLADQIEAAIAKTLSQGVMTADIGGQAKTSEMVSKIIQNL
ncbi:3-isopropylmalate dehydrogenase [Limosilactobacillus gastricus]|uniref:3-isopropylmalate dehydrogenase n=1 Tax=Limosilactobacillus gastricus DSM 16045 TaxID=1423749 RepID=A0A0R1V951_9LACO|nr:3-isopropylmalate dehydrogenase [Limosilactobacillus gastricus]KRM02034.1 3-isopropylmalate dehydrogenase [Limosilactobacillus gastricus DSM 16045]QGF39964.1 3-isopropylmalate dehydrogenase [Limosilactobacillus gastricus]